ncbi:hypothetical protein [Candidatus Solincola sp.]|nr:hypothetical protein [Actinomycetota bacterium]
MRKYLVVMLAGLLALTAAVTIIGCGGEKDLETAKSLMKDGDLSYDKVETAKSTLEEKQADIAKSLLSGDKSGVTPEQMEQTKEDIGKIVSGVKADLQAAKASYEQILQLEGVEKYKEYAEKMLEVVEKDEELLAQVEALIAKFMQMLSSMQPGTMPDLSVLLESEEMKKINELSETIDNLMNEANKLKKELE